MRQLTLEQDAEDLLALWRDARDRGPLPDAGFASATNLRHWVGDLSVVRLREGEKRFYVSLHGSNVMRHLGPDFQRKFLEDSIPPSQHADAFAPYNLSISTNQPSYSIQRASLSNSLFKSLERMIMPLHDGDPAEIDRFLVWIRPTKKSGARSSSVYEPFGELDLARCEDGEPELSSDLFLLSDEYRSSHAAA